MEFREFSSTTFTTTLQKWVQEAEKYDCFPEEVERKLAWIQESLQHKDNGTKTANEVLPYGVFVEGQDIAVATCELILSDRGVLGGKWLKMLKVTLSPEIEVLMQEDNVDATLNALLAYKAATLGAYSARLDHSADTLKLFARDNDQMKFLMALMAHIRSDQSNSSLEATREGRWLVLRSV